MSLCLLNQDGEIHVHRKMPAGPEPLRKTIAPYCEAPVVYEGLNSPGPEIGPGGLLYADAG
jgi:hypothetical protein